MDVNGVKIIENVQTVEGDGDVVMEPGSVDTKSNPLVKSVNSMDVDTRLGFWHPFEWIVDVEKSFVAGANVLYDVFNVAFKVPKYDAQYLITTKFGQLEGKDCDIVIQAFNAGLLFEKTNIHGGKFYWIDEDHLNRRRNELNTRGDLRVGEETLLAALGELCIRVGFIVLNKVKEAVTIQVGGRYKLEENGYWFIKNDKGIFYILNDLADPNNPLLVDLAPGDCYFYFGTEIDLTEYGFRDLKVTFCFDDKFNLIFGGSFGEWTITPRDIYDGALSLAKRACVAINDTVCSFYSTVTGWISSITREIDDGLPHYPGLTCVELYDTNNNTPIIINTRSITNNNKPSTTTNTNNKNNNIVKDKTLFNK